MLKKYCDAALQLKLLKPISLCFHKIKKKDLTVCNFKNYKKAMKANSAKNYIRCVYRDLSCD